MVGSTADISDRKQAEEALLKSEERFRILVNSAPVGIFQTDAKGDCLFVNPRWIEIAGISQEKALGTGWADALHPEDRERVFTQWYNAAQTGSKFALECRFLTPEAKVNWVFTTAEAIHNPSGAITGYLGTLTDISDRKRVEEALQKSEARFRVAAEGSLDAFFIFQSLRDETGQIIDFTFTDLNANAEKMISMSKEQVIGERMCELLPANRRDGFFEKYARVVETGIPLEEDFSISTPEITASWLHHQVVPLSDGIAITTRDITERKRMEEQMRRTRNFLQTTIDHLPVAVFVKDGKEDRFGEFRLWNKTCEKMFGLTSEQAVGKTVHDLFPKPQAEFFYQKDQEIFA
jgi:PAS domain S-box-containing protein